MQLGPVGKVFEDLRSTPLGKAAGDMVPGSAQNQSPDAEYVKCYVRNWSANSERKFLSEFVSGFGGGERAEEAAKIKGEYFDLGRKQALAFKGQDQSVYSTAIKPVTPSLEFDSKRFLIPPSSDPKKDPEWVPIPTGLMDLYHGNPDRLNSPDEKIKSLELERLALKRGYLQARDVCVRRDKKGKNQNPFGFLEFKREIIEPMNVAIDTDHVYSDQYVEV